MNIEQARKELPGWTVYEKGAEFYARSPDFDTDGLIVYGRDWFEVVNRVRMHVQIFALAANRAGRLAPNVAMAGVWLNARSSAVRLVENSPPDVLSDVPMDPIAKPDLTYQQARTLGYTGEECPQCFSVSTVRNGTCLLCKKCGATTGCG